MRLWIFRAFRRVGLGLPANVQHQANAGRLQGFGESHALVVGTQRRAHRTDAVPLELIDDRHLFVGAEVLKAVDVDADRAGLRRGGARRPSDAGEENSGHRQAKSHSRLQAKRGGHPFHTPTDGIVCPRHERRARPRCDGSAGRVAVALPRHDRACPGHPRSDAAGDRDGVSETCFVRQPCRGATTSMPGTSRVMAVRDLAATAIALNRRPPLPPLARLG